MGPLVSTIDQSSSGVRLHGCRRRRPIAFCGYVNGEALHRERYPKRTLGHCLACLQYLLFSARFWAYPLSIWLVILSFSDCALLLTHSIFSGLHTLVVVLRHPRVSGVVLWNV